MKATNANGIPAPKVRDLLSLLKILDEKKVIPLITLEQIETSLDIFGLILIKQSMSKLLNSPLSVTHYMRRFSF